jgi:hypothetical protein
LAATADQDILRGLGLELRDFVRHTAFDQVGIIPIGVLQALSAPWILHEAIQ